MTELPEPKQEKLTEFPNTSLASPLLSPGASNVLLRIAEVWLLKMS